MALAPPAQKRGPFSNRPQSDTFCAQNGTGGGGGPASEQADVGQAKPAALVQIAHKVGGQRQRCREALPGRPCQRGNGDAVFPEHLTDLGVGVQRGEELDLRRTERGPRRGHLRLLRRVRHHLIEPVVFRGPPHHAASWTTGARFGRDLEQQSGNGLPVGSCGRDDLVDRQQFAKAVICLQFPSIRPRMW